MREWDLREAISIVADIRKNLLDHPDILDIWVEEDTEQVVTIGLDGFEYFIPVSQFIRENAPSH